MPTSAVFLILFLLTSKPAFAAVETPIKLIDAFRAALRQSETIAIQSERIIQTEEDIKQAKGSILPVLNGTASYFRQQQASTAQFGESISPSSEPLIKFTLSQPLFRGLRDFAALRVAKALHDAQAETKQQAIINLNIEVAENFYSISAAEKDLINLRNEVKIFNERLLELKHRVKIGRSPVNDTLTTESNIASLHAQIAQLQNQIAAARQNFVQLTGLPVDTQLSEPVNSNFVLDSVQKYLSRIEERPDIIAAKNQLDAANRTIWIAKGAHLPSADLNANYYLKRAGFLSDSHWDFTLSLTVPIFSGGIIQSEVRKSISQRTQSELMVEELRRQAITQVQNYYDSCLFGNKQVALLAQSRASALKSYEQQNQDYRLGLVSNLDVLQSFVSYQYAVRAYDRAIFTRELDCRKLEASVARNSTELLREGAGT